MTNTIGSTNSTSTTGSTSVVKPNEAKGNQQGQTTLAAKVSRWEVLVNNLSKEVTEMAKFKNLLDPFTAILNEAKDIRDQQKILRAQRGKSMDRRLELIAQGNDLYGRLQLMLKADLGPQNAELHSFGLKPARKAGRKPKGTTTSRSTPPTAPVSTATTPTTADTEPRK